MNSKKEIYRLIIFFLFLWLMGIVMTLCLSSKVCNYAGDYCYDARGYWERGACIWQDGSFSLLKMNGFRGYVYPLFCGFCNVIGGVKGFAVINSLVFSIWWLLCHPRLHEQKIMDFDKKGFLSIIICFLLFNLFFYGLSICPLSDLFAIVICSIGILFLMPLEKGCFWPKALVYCVLAGCMSYFAYNVRTIYLFGAIYIFVRLAILIWKNIGVIWQKIVLIVGYLLGVFLAALPQLYMNYKSLGIISMKVQTGGLMLKQLYWGLLYQRYDTYLYGVVAEHEPQIYFTDPVGSALLAKEGITEFLNWSDFFAFIIKHPFDVIGIYVRHLVNVLFPCWPSQYVKNLDNNKIIIGFISYVCIFLFCVAVYNKFIKKKFLQNYMALLVPCIFILPGAVEVRFAAALYIMMIGTLCYNVQWSDMKAYILENKIKLLIAFLVLGGLMLALWTSMLASDSTYSIFMS